MLPTLDSALVGQDAVSNLLLITLLPCAQGSMGGRKLHADLMQVLEIQAEKPPVLFRVRVSFTRSCVLMCEPAFEDMHAHM